MIGANLGALKSVEHKFDLFTVRYDPNSGPVGVTSVASAEVRRMLLNKLKIRYKIPRPSRGCAATSASIRAKNGAFLFARKVGVVGCQNSSRQSRREITKAL